MKLSRRSLLSSGAVIAPVVGLGPAIAAADGFRSSRPSDSDNRSVHGYGETRQGSAGLRRSAARLQISSPVRRGQTAEVRRPGSVAARRHGRFRGAERPHRARTQSQLRHRRRRGGWRATRAAHRERHVRSRRQSGRHVDAARRPRPPARQGLDQLGGNAGREFAGGPTPSGTLLTLRGRVRLARQADGYVFEVDPFRGGNAVPDVGMGRYEHKAVAFDRQGIAYLTEDADSPFGCIYRYLPSRPFGGRGSLHKGGQLQALVVPGLGSDLSIVQNVGMVLNAQWVDVPNPNPRRRRRAGPRASGRLARRRFRKPKACWTGKDGAIWFVCSYGGGPEPRTRRTSALRRTAARSGNTTPSRRRSSSSCCSPSARRSTAPTTSRSARTASPSPAPTAKTINGSSASPTKAACFRSRRTPTAIPSSPSATFSPDGRAPLFVNQQDPGWTYAIWGPWGGEQDGWKYGELAGFTEGAWQRSTRSQARRPTRPVLRSMSRDATHAAVDLHAEAAAELLYLAAELGPQDIEVVRSTNKSCFVASVSLAPAISISMARTNARACAGATLHLSRTSSDSGHCIGIR